MKTEQKLLPTNVRRIWRVADLPQNRNKAQYAVNNEGEKTSVTLSKRKRQVLDLLCQGPVYCASPVRLSDIVFLLKSEDGINIETLRFPGDPANGTGPFGVYALRSEVRPIDELEEAA